MKQKALTLRNQTENNSNNPNPENIENNPNFDINLHDGIHRFVGNLVNGAEQLLGLAGIGFYEAIKPEVTKGLGYIGLPSALQVPKIESMMLMGLIKAGDKIKEEQIRLEKLREENKK